MLISDDLCWPASKQLFIAVKAIDDAREPACMQS